MKRISRKYRRALLIFLIIVVSAISLELLFRGYLHLKGRDVIMVLPPDEVLKKAWFRPHPHLLYVFKPNTSFTMNRFDRGKFTINEHGFRSTLEYDVKDVIKSPNTIRIATLGGSTTMGVNDDDQIWPYLLGRNLAAALPQKKIEVLNEGIMGYNSLDNLLDLSMRVIDFNCDIYVIYLGVNDLPPAAPLEVYRTDYSHYRMTIYESLYGSPVSLMPGLLMKPKVVRALLQILRVPDSRNLVENTGTAQFRRRFSLTSDDTTTISKRIRRTVVRNVKSMIGIIRIHQPHAIIILSSFYDLDNRPVLTAMNKDFQRLAIVQKVAFADPAAHIRKKRKMAYDYGHFTPEGDSRMAELFSRAILSEMARK